MPDRHAGALAVLDREQRSLGIDELKSEARDDGRCEVRLRVSVDAELVRLRFLLPARFPDGEIEIFVDDAEWRRFAHQNHQGKICPDPRMITRTDDERIIEAVEAARGWLDDARSGALTPPAVDYELPSFPWFDSWMAIFDEEASDASRWLEHVGRWGPVRFSRTEHAWAAAEFSSHGTGRIASRSSIRIDKTAATFDAIWAMTGGLPAERYVPPKTWDELRAFVPDLDAAVYRAWTTSTLPYAVLLVGWPMPKTWDGPLERIHWRPIRFESHEGARERLKKQGHLARGRSPKVSLLKPMQLWKVESPIRRARDLMWAKSEDVSRERLYVRTAESERSFEHVLLLGAGAIGSTLADGLVRNGLGAITVVDKDRLEYGNLCRHVLTAKDVGREKAVALEEHLRSVAPHVRAQSEVFVLPPLVENDVVAFERRVEKADVIVDATGSDDVLRWISPMNESRVVVSIWTNSNATVGVGVISGFAKGADVGRLREHAVAEIDAGRVQGVSAASYRGPAPIRPGIGCWHPTFRGSWSRLSGLAASFSEWLETSVRDAKDGRVIVYRFHEGGWRRARAWQVSADVLLRAANDV